MMKTQRCQRIMSGPPQGRSTAVKKAPLPLSSPLLLCLCARVPPNESRWKNLRDCFQTIHFTTRNDDPHQNAAIFCLSCQATPIAHVPTTNGPFKDTLFTFVVFSIFDIEQATADTVVSSSNRPHKIIFSFFVLLPV